MLICRAALFGQSNGPIWKWTFPSTPSLIGTSSVCPRRPFDKAVFNHSQHQRSAPIIGRTPWISLNKNLVLNKHKSFAFSSSDIVASSWERVTGIEIECCFDLVTVDALDAVMSAALPPASSPLFLRAECGAYVSVSGMVLSFDSIKESRSSLAIFCISCTVWPYLVNQYWARSS